MERRPPRCRFVRATPRHPSPRSPRGARARAPRAVPRCSANCGVCAAQSVRRSSVAPTRTDSGSTVLIVSTTGARAARPARRGPRTCRRARRRRDTSGRAPSCTSTPSHAPRNGTQTFVNALLARRPAAHDARGALRREPRESARIGSNDSGSVATTISSISGIAAKVWIDHPTIGKSGELDKLLGTAQTRAAPAATMTAAHFKKRRPHASAARRSFARQPFAARW